ncbi:TRAP transporter substrate-binding protein DctP [Nocardia sp. NPDC050799]|uniref:TRAP transporter substrate-binding protein DctP n=1 Tax=Nocardia sp. NPDC050799 TaxID=3154842 RepID=UPI0033F46DF8
MKPTPAPSTARGVRTRRVVTLLSAAVAALLAVTACSGSSDGGGGGVSVAAGATKAEFRAALADMDPVEMKVQVLTPKEAAYSKAWEDYGKALDDWSGGKITFKMHYSGAIVPTDVSGALSDGLIDAAPFQPVFEPDKFPVASFIGKRSATDPNTPVAGPLGQFASWAEVGYHDSIVRELEDNGIHPLVPIVMAGGPFQLICGDKPYDTLADLGGASVRVASPANEAEVKALGASPVSLPTLEVFEGIQRGTVDCAVMPTTLAYAINIAEVAKNWTVDPRGGFASTHETLGVSQATWDDLPLAARQLMHDRLDVFFGTYIPGHIIGGGEISMKQVEKAGGTLHRWDDEAWKRLDDHHRSGMTNVDDAPAGVDGSALVRTVITAQEKWLPKVEELGYRSELGWDELVGHLAKQPLDPQSLIDELRAEILDNHRPE